MRLPYHSPFLHFSDMQKGGVKNKDYSKPLRLNGNPLKWVSFTITRVVKLPATTKIIQLNIVSGDIISAFHVNANDNTNPQIIAISP